MVKTILKIHILASISEYGSLGHVTMLRWNDAFGTWQ